MISKKTVFVVGAGASVDFGFPVGKELTSIISELLHFTFDDYLFEPNLVNGDKSIFETIVSYAKEGKGPHQVNERVREYLTAAQLIVEGMPLQASIDNYLQNHQHLEEILTLGKLGIVRSIWRKEADSQIYKPNMRSEKKLQFGSLAPSWLLELMPYLNADVPQERIENIFDNVSFISFNYDRCIEHFLYNALQASFSYITPDRAAEIMQKLNIIYPYGSAGEMPWKNLHQYNDFGGEGGVSLGDVANGIKTYSEFVESNELKTSMKQLIQKANTIVFLGFAFHPQNMKLLKCMVSDRLQNIYATAFKVPLPVQGEFNARIKSTFDVGTNKRLCAPVIVEHDCINFIKDYGALL